VIPRQTDPEGAVSCEADVYDHAEHTRAPRRIRWGRGAVKDVGFRSHGKAVEHAR